MLLVSKIYRFFSDFLASFQANHFMSLGLIESQFCAGELAGNKDTCKFHFFKNAIQFKKKRYLISTQTELSLLNLRRSR